MALTDNNPSDRDPPETGGRATRNRILQASATLFAKLGFHGTSTRDIAEAVGIRQPSLFHHFPTKQAILSELLEGDLRPALQRIRCHRSTGGGAAARCYVYIATDLAIRRDAAIEFRPEPPHYCALPWPRFLPSPLPPCSDQAISLVVLRPGEDG